MKNKLLISLIVLLFVKFSLAQEERPEVLYMNCLYDSFDDKADGIAFKNVLKNFEKQLVKDGMLDNNDGKSYIRFLEKLSKNEIDNLIMSTKFMEAMRKKKPNPEKVSLCNDIIEESKDIESTKFGKLNGFMESIRTSDNIVSSDYAKGLLSILTAEDFELDFYKLNILYFFSIVNVNMDSGLLRKLPKENKDVESEKLNLENAIHVSLNEKDELLLNGEKITLAKLKKKVKKYEKKYKSESVIILRNSYRAKYATYIEVQSAIISAVDSLRDDFAQKLYNKNYEELDKSEAKKVKKIYPLNLKEFSLNDY